MPTISKSKPELYLFLSVDIINSTKLKYPPELECKLTPEDSECPLSKKELNCPLTKSKCISKINDKDYWFTSIRRFYEEFPEQLKQQINSTKAEFGTPDIEDCKIWKLIGDEILFSVKINKKDEVPCIIKAFEKTIDEWYSNDEHKTIHLKGCAWIGQIPFIDKKVKVMDAIDFLGTSIDCGFRLGKYADENLIVLSIEVVDLCEKCNNFHLEIRYFKSEKLKGVLNNFNYPIFTLVLSNCQKTLEQELLFNENSIAIKSYIDAYYKKMEKEYPRNVSRINENIEEYLKDKADVANKIQLEDEESNIKSEIKLKETDNTETATLTEDYKKELEEYQKEFKKYLKTFFNEPKK